MYINLFIIINKIKLPSKLLRLKILSHYLRITLE